MITVKLNGLYMYHIGMERYANILAVLNFQTGKMSNRGFITLNILWNFLNLLNHNTMSNGLINTLKSIGVTDDQIIEIASTRTLKEAVTLVREYVAKKVYIDTLGAMRIVQHIKHYFE